MDVLIHISQQLSNSTIPAYTPAEFTVSPSIATVNVLFFLSLALVLIDAFLAMLVKSWLQEFDRGWRKYTVANLRAQERERRLQGLERWKLAELVVLLPILIQVSLLLFCVGLLVLLFPIHLISAIFSLVALLAGLTFYVFTTYVSIFDSYAPFSSPVSRGLTILFNAFQITWITFAHNVQSLISHAWVHISNPLSPREHEPSPNPSTQSLPGWGKVACSPMHRDIQTREAVPRSQSQIDYQTYASILERLVATTPEAVENIPVFLDLLDQPVKDLTLRPSNLEKWKLLLRTTVGLLGDPSTFSDSAARTVARTLLFCYDSSEYADWELSRRLKHHFEHRSTGQTDKYDPLNSLFASYLHYYCGFMPIDTRTVMSTFASLAPSNAADLELLWMVNTIHKSLLWKDPDSFVYGLALEFFAAVLTYVSSTEQSRRSQVPLTAAIIYAMHTIKAALDTNSIGSIDGPYVIPRTVINTFESMFVPFHQVDELDLWSDGCVELASALLQPHTHWPEPCAEDVWKFQLALIAALYIDSTKQAGHAPTTFGHLLSLTTIPNITEHTWEWASVYDQTKLAGHWYMALFQEPIYQKNSPIPDIVHIIMETIEHCSEIRLSALHLLDISVNHLCSMVSSPSNLPMRGIDNDCIAWTTPDGLSDYYAFGPFNPWILLHLDTLLPQSSFLHLSELAQLELADTPEQVHIAMARLAYYDSLQGKQYKAIKWLEPDLHVLELFLWSKDYEVCTSAFKRCLNLAMISQPSSTGCIHSAEMFASEMMGHQWIEHCVQVLCGDSVFGNLTLSSWEFLAEHLAPKWAMLPPSWRCDFALVFLFSNVHLSDMDEQPACQWIAEALIESADEALHTEAFLLFLGVMLEHIQHSLHWDQLTSLETWLAQLPYVFERQDVYVKLENVIATQKQQIADATLGFFAELPMTYTEWMNDVQ